LSWLCQPPQSIMEGIVSILLHIGREGLEKTKTPGWRISYLCYTPKPGGKVSSRDINVCTIYHQKPKRPVLESAPMAKSSPKRRTEMTAVECKIGPYVPLSPDTGTQKESSHLNRVYTCGPQFPWSLKSPFIHHPLAVFAIASVLA
jgi:hypothetical protein